MDKRARGFTFQGVAWTRGLGVPSTADAVCFVILQTSPLINQTLGLEFKSLSIFLGGIVCGILLSLCGDV